MSDSLDERISMTTQAGVSNCIGTALFLSGLSEVDEAVDINGEAFMRIGHLPKLKEPELGCLVSFQNWTGTPSRLKRIAYRMFGKRMDGVTVWHLAVVESLDQLTVAHRDSYRGSIQRAVPLNDLIDIYGLLGMSITYYSPNRVK